jgi:hypothetical protein
MAYVFDKKEERRVVMREIKGRLLYTAWSDIPWRLAAGHVDVFLSPAINRFLASLNGKRISQRRWLGGYVLAADETGPRFEHVNESPSVRANIMDVIIWLSGRLVKLEIENGERIMFSADDSEKVVGVCFNGNGSCVVPRGAEKTACRIGRRDQCIFLAGEGCDSLHCMKFSGREAVKILGQVPQSDARAAHIGNCALLG